VFCTDKKILVNVIFLIQELDVLDFKSRHKKMVLLIPKMARPVLGPTQPPIRRKMGFFPPGVKRADREIDCSPLYRAEVRNEWCHTSSSSLFLRGVARHNFIFRLTGLNLAVLSGMK
jgi:hypothetical protein